MSGALTSSMANVRDLDGEASAKVLAKAVEQGAAVYLRYSGKGTELLYSGAVVGEDRAHLVLELYRVEPAAGAILRLFLWQVSMIVNGVRYVFETRCADQPAKPTPAVIRIFKPATIVRAERRRSPRRRLRKPTKVTLRAIGLKPGSPGSAYEGSLLNVSLEGLACRLRTSDAATFRVGETLRAAFDLGASLSAFDCKARIINMTQCATAGHLVLGLEFIQGQSGAVNRRRLREALATADGTDE